MTFSSRFLILSWPILVASHCVYADEATFNLCMARANAIRTTAEVRDKGVSQHEYEVRYVQMAGRPLTAAENEVVILAYGASDYSPSQLYNIAVNGCQKFQQ